MVGGGGVLTLRMTKSVNMLQLKLKSVYGNFGIDNVLHTVLGGS